MSNSETKNRIVFTASELFYQQGFEATSFAKLSSALSLSKGNIYHHFKSKDQLLNAVVNYRLKQTQDMIDCWDIANTTPEDRIMDYVKIVIRNWHKIKLYGCPVGSLSNEMVKLDYPSESVHRVFTLFRHWLKSQFIDIGASDKADEYAMHILSWSQGVATMSAAFKELDFVHKEVDRITSWVNSLRQHPN
ncbi:TetR/AcrR family transcriptional regulator [Agaribacter marinus]|uniref:TetR family transcriptional regulator n=1 Tax=Agaribacter marinus TaxID=1431249 RepID=A0AA37T0A9_9ALTE|nr:TetR/AcrR family transcriptional regulator [Agaribacter marinus]GLR71969.1 TetR family transcriptional regulator [Agaribacter marinus]